jgi:hypothetical protein
MSEPELTPEAAAAMFGRKPEGSDDGPSSDDQTPVELNEDEAELARRYSLSPDDVKRVRGETWAERDQDAARLAATIEHKPERESEAAQEHPEDGGIQAALAGADAGKESFNRAFVERAHGATRQEDEKIAPAEGERS